MRTIGEGTDRKVHLSSAERRGFRAREDGSLTIFSLFMFILILMIAGTAVDLVRHERERVAMQNTLDTAVLAASGVSQNLDATAVVKDYVAKAGFDPDYVQVTSKVNYTGASVTSRSVEASTQVRLDTMFMNMMGIDSLASPSRTSAEERNTKIEIALVLDISGSMNQNSAQSGVTKIAALKQAAKEFLTVMFDANDADDIVVSIIPYNHQVTMPDSIMSRLNMEQSTVTIASPPAYTGALDEYRTMNEQSRCAVFANEDYTTRRLTRDGSVERSGRFLEDRFYWANATGLVQQAFEEPYEWALWCNNDQTRFMPYSNNEADLAAYIDGLEAAGATAINIGLNWGVALLDPSFQPVVDDMVMDGEIPAELGIYPTNYANKDTQKYVVLMTDGQNTNQFDLKPDYKAGATRVWYAESDTLTGTITYDVTSNVTDAVTGIVTAVTTEETRELTSYDGYYVLMPDKPADQRWYKPGLPFTTADDQYLPEAALPADAVQIDYHELYERFGVRSAARFFFRHSDYPAYAAHFYPAADSGWNQADDNTNQICTQAKSGQAITVYTVAFEAPTNAQTLLQGCATAPGYYFDVDGTQISDAFSAIANQIALLRLTE